VRENLTKAWEIKDNNRECEKRNRVRTSRCQ
jgi:hypothetical protein